jgi:hypothetical protein
MISKVKEKVKMSDREKDIQTLCSAVKENFAKWEYWENSYDRYICVFCGNEVNDRLTPEDIEHSIDCAVLIAKDLSAK